MSAGAVGEGPRYWAFISYSHKDAAQGRRLHRKLESYQFPRRQVGSITPQGVLPRRLIPIFRDRDELPAATDLSKEVRAALASSRALVVVCSPAAASSKWVEREIETFRMLHPDRPILGAIVEGTPEEAIPASLRRKVGAAYTEPLAADFRSEADGPRLALLKLVAGIAGVKLDELVQRDGQRRLQRVMAITAGAFLGMLAMGVLSGYALRAQADADRQRAEAEGLVEFMLTDLRTTLKGVGRLDAMAAVNKRALQYYGGNTVDSLPAASLERRVRILHAMGEDDEARGDWSGAIGKFTEARRTTAALLAKAPNDPDRIFDQAQSEFWIGAVAYEQKHYVEARQRFDAYKALTDRLLKQDPTNPRSLREAGYAYGNLCTMAIEADKNGQEAIVLCKKALDHMEAASRWLQGATDIRIDIANRHAWLADAYSIAGNRAECIAHRRTQEVILADLMRVDPKNMLLKEKWIAVQRVLGWLELESGNKKAALDQLQKALALSNQLVAFDPTNQSWERQRSAVISDTEQIQTVLRKEAK